MSFRDRDTGFPDSFCGNRNTSLPHPDAKLGPDACITEDDVNVGRAIVRHRMSFQAQQGRPYGRSLSTSSDEGTFSALGRMALTSFRGVELPPTGTSDGVRPFSKDGESITSSDGMSSRAPDSPTQHVKQDPRDAVRDPRDGHRRRKSNLIGRLLHR